MPLESQPNPELLLQHADFLRSLARGLLAGADADDVEQETWLRALEKGPRHDANLKGWLATVARNSARLMWRSESRRTRREERVAKSEGVPSAADVASRVEIQSLLADAVKSLEEPYRTTVVLAFYDGLSPTEIARKQGIPVDTVRTRIRRALQRLRAALDQHPGGRPAWMAALVPLAWPKGAAAAVTGALVMSTRLKILLVLVLLIPTAWLGREAWRGHAERTPVRTTNAERTVGELTDGATGEAPKAMPGQTPEEIPAAAAGFVARIVADGEPVRGAWVRIEGGGAELTTFESTGVDGLVRTGHTANVRVNAWHPSRGPAELTVAEVEPGRIVDVELPPGTTVPIEVLDAKTGAGIPGATVYVLSAGSDRQTNAGIDNAFEKAETIAQVLPAISIEDILVRSQGVPAFRIEPQQTDERGQALLHGLPEGTFEAIVLHEDYLTRRVKKAPVRNDPVRIRMSVGATLDVVAPTVRGRPGVGLVCEVKRGGIMSMGVGVARLDERGNAHFEHLPAGDFVVVVSSEGTDSFIVGVGAMAPPPEEGEAPKPEPIKAIARVVTLRDGEATTVHFADQTGTRLFGRVRGASGALADRALWLHRGTEKIAETRTDAEGRYSFDQLEPGSYRLRADLDDSILVEKEVTIEAGQRELELDVEPAAGAVRGNVVDREGRRVKGCEVVLVRAIDGPDETLEAGGEAAILHALRGRGETDDDGRFRVAGVAAGTYRVLFGHEGRLVARSVTVGEGETVDVDVDFGRERTHELRVRFEGPDGKPRDGALLLRGEHNGFGEAYAVGVDLEARKEFAFHLPPGRYRLTATSPGLAAIHGEVVDVGGDRAVTLAFAEAVEFELAVRNGAAPVARAKVELIQQNGVRLGPADSLLSIVQAPRMWTTDDSGEVVIGGVPPGTYRVRIEGRGAGSVRITKESRKHTIDLATR